MLTDHFIVARQWTYLFDPLMTRRLHGIGNFAFGSDETEADVTDSWENGSTTQRRRYQRCSAALQEFSTSDAQQITRRVSRNSVFKLLDTGKLPSVPHSVLSV